MLIWRFREQFLVSAEGRFPILPSVCTISTECSWHLNGCSLIAKYRVIILSDTVTSHFPSARWTYSLHTGSSSRCISQRLSVFQVSNIIAINSCPIAGKLTIILREEWPTAHNSMRDLKCATGCRILSTKLLLPRSQTLNQWYFYLGGMLKDEMRKL